MRSRPTPPPLAGVVVAVVAAACGGPSVRLAPEPVSAAVEPPLTREMGEELAAAERLYRAGAPGFAARRDELAADPARAFWLTRMLVRDAVFAYDRRGELAAADANAFARPTDPVWTRATEHLRALGAAAMPAIEVDLLRSPRQDRRRLGVALCADVGTGAAPRLRELATSSDAVMRRLALQALAQLPPDLARYQVFADAADDGDFTVRAAAYEGMAITPDRAASTLRRALAAEADPFVRMVIAHGLAAAPGKESARALVAYLRKAAAAADVREMRAAHEALAALAGRDPRQPRAVDAWAAWAEGLADDWKGDDGRVEDRSR